MALADVLRERVSRRGRTAEVACGLLGTVTVEALPPRECAALGLRDGGRALLYAACRDLQTAGETLRREGRLFTPAEVTAYVSDEEAAAAARTVLALSGVTTDGRRAHRQKARKSDLVTCRTTGHIWRSKRRPGRKSDLVTCRKTRKSDMTACGTMGRILRVKRRLRGNSDLLTCRKTGILREKSDMRTCGKRRFKRRKSDLVTCGNRTVRQKMDKSHMSFSAGTVQTGQPLSWVVFPILYHKILRCPRKMTGFQHLWNCPGTLRKCPGEGRICTKLSRKSEKRCTKRSRNLRRRDGVACTKASRKSRKRCTK